jgi:carbamate kinase
MAESNVKYVDDAGRGWRRVAASPKPIDIYEKITLKTLLHAGHVVIACGGGGIPVVYRGSRYWGVDAVVDKDFAAAKLAHLTEADTLMILTAVDRVMINFHKPDEKALERMSVDEAQAYAAQGHFAPGSMLPKVLAACDFAGSGLNRRAVITSLERAGEALTGKSGTEIYSA